MASEFIGDMTITHNGQVVFAGKARINGSQMQRIYPKDAPRLPFRDPQFVPGLNSTIRLGTHWAERLKPGDRVVLLDKEGNPFAETTIRGVAQMTLGMVTQDVLYNGLLRRKHHNQLAVAGAQSLYAYLHQMYAGRTDVRVHSGQLVTVIYFDSPA